LPEVAYRGVLMLSCTAEKSYFKRKIYIEGLSSQLPSFKFIDTNKLSKICQACIIFNLNLYAYG
jgi:hypothetical protein